MSHSMEGDIGAEGLSITYTLYVSPDAADLGVSLFRVHSYPRFIDLLG